ncbi:MAG: tRNA (N6-isopentenyl adenosine(37)-C2)-methylthiotransferase MiaB, partial [Bifidobacteriaceae bacterium]|nr:tRNA (N6-isopentenyl adenosine(37)-C2)-methylthiotransferase MiaB [Bifidobacteriaceae bacterium]
MKTYYIKTLGCQMNEHDSQRIAGMLESLDFKPSERLNDFKDVNADIVVINTCAVRQNAATRLYGNLGMLKKSKLKSKKMIIAVGGCLAQLDRETIIKKAPWVDIVFGTNNLQSLPHLIKRVENNEKNAVEIAEHLEVFPSSLPTHIANPYSAYVTISAGCDENCTFCIVPQLRGREQDRDPADIISEIQALIQNGYKEITLLGQNVNSYGKKLRDENGKPYRFANLLQDVAKINGLKRLRYMSPHPASFEDNVIDAMQAHPNIMPSIHLPLQSGSNKVLRDMKRSYKISHYKKIIEKLKNSIPDIEITTDIIVGFPTETDEDFEETLNIIRDVEFLSAYT